MTIKLIRNIARFLLGLVFIFSGLSKAIDPLGSAYKFTDYFDAFGMDFMAPMSLFLAILQNCVELLIGLTLFFKIRMKETAWAVMLFMGFYTILTFILALTNPVTDCGCFGDALILTNWQTFIKNLIFLVPAIIIFQQRNKFLVGLNLLIEWSVSGLFFAGSAVISIYCLLYLPLIDFRPYKIGTNIAGSMIVPDGLPHDEYETILIYEKEGEKREFTLTSPEMPWSDSTWKWVETKNILVKEGYQPPIHDFSLTSSEGENITDQLLKDKSYSMLIVAYNLDKANADGVERINALALKAADAGIKVYGMTSSVDQSIEVFNKKFHPSYKFYTTDEITLKTMIRSNPGVILIKESVVIGMWPHRNLPDADLLSKDTLAYSITSLQQSRNERFLLIIMLSLGLLGLLVYLVRLDL
jgi:uncharacterized membrane protein YphA (DoxX/SURF4 family)